VFFTMSFSKCICLICQTSIAVPKKGKVERHFQTLHKKHENDFPARSELRGTKVKELKSPLTGQVTFFSPRPESKGSHGGIIPGESSRHQTQHLYKMDN